MQTLLTMGAMHGYGIARRIEQVSGDEILLNQGTIYASLVRLQQRGWISAEWGPSDHNRKAKYYSITRSGRKQITGLPRPALTRPVPSLGLTFANARHLRPISWDDLDKKEGVVIN